MSSVFCMAAGKGTRLAPWTLVVPKPALPVANEPALGFLFRHLARHGHRDVVANASWLGDVLTGMFGDGSAYGVSLEWCVEEEPLGTAGGVLAAQDRLRDGDAPILVVSGDGIHDIDLTAVERVHRESGADATIALISVADASQYGVAVLDADGRITGFQEKPARGTELSRLANTGIYVLSPRALDACGRWGLTDFGSELFPRMLDEGMHVQGADVQHAYWNDIGDLDEWRATNTAVLRGDVEAAGFDTEDGSGDDILIHPGAEVHPEATLIGPCVVGAGARVEAGARLRSALALPNAVVPSGLVVASGTVGSVDGLRAWAHELAGVAV